METGRFGSKLSFYAVLGFILAFLGQTFLCGLLLGFVILVEKNDWLTKQMIQAFLLTIVSSVVHSVLSILDIFEAIPFLGVVFSWLFGLVNGIVALIVLLFAIAAIIRVMKGQDARLPLLSIFSDWAFGFANQDQN